MQITELEKIDATRVDGVDSPANGIPILLMKAVAEPAVKGARDCPKCEASFDADHKGNACPECGAKLPDGDDAAKASDDKQDCPTCKGDGKIMGNQRDCPDCDATGKVTPDKAKQLAAKSLVRSIIGKAVGADGQVDEAPDIAGGTEVLSQIADLIISEAQELKAGQAGEISDILELAYAAQAIWCWRTGEQAVASGSVMPADALMQSAAKAKHNTADRKKLAEAGNALSDGSYPIADEDDLKSAAILAQSGHGDVDGAKRLISRRSKELGVKNPLDDSSDDTAKGAIAQEDTTVDTVTKETGDLSKVVEDAVTKAMASLRDELSSVRDELAKVKATPIPNGPVMSAAARPARQGESRDDEARKAAYYREMAATVTSDERAAEGYRQLARQAEERAKTAS